jgi:uridine kinase|tara:strand:+ start:499 stop:1503 length:1005 start_codon:yes stop_codon:yes gene_type:complete
MKNQISKKLAEKVGNRPLKEMLNNSEDRIFVIGIDGPTAVGKTILANTLVNHIEDLLHRECWIFRLDWTLAKRDERTEDLKNLISKDIIFPFEAELHMRLHLAKEFLELVSLYNEQLENGKHSLNNLHLENLYSREDNGKLSGSENCSLKKELIIIVEGHYTLQSALNNLIDFNILLLSNKDELLHRKSLRVKGYRNKDDAKDYFWRVDIPSFLNHLNRYSFNADIVVDNSDYNNPSIVHPDYITNWVTSDLQLTNDERKKSNNFKEIANHILSESLMVDKELKRGIESVFDFIIKWDQLVGEYLRNSIDNIDGDLITKTKQLSEEYSVLKVQI